MTPADVSVIIPAYNAAEFIGPALDSIAAQTRLPREVVVVDDGSKDDTGAVVRRWIAEHAAPAVTLVQKANGGISRARNDAIAASQGAWIAMLDADDLWRPRHLEALLDAAGQAPAAVLAYGAGHVLEDGVESSVPYDEFWDHPSRRHGQPLPGSDSLLVGRPALGRLLRGNFIKPTSVMVRRAALDRVGLFDPRLPTAEDRELLVRLLLDGPFVYTPESISLYRTHAENATHDKHARRNMESGLRAISMILAEHGPRLDAAERAAGREALTEAGERYLDFCAAEGWRQLRTGARFLQQNIKLQPPALIRTPRRMLRSVLASLTP